VGGKFLLASLEFLQVRNADFVKFYDHGM
jgi:hypothetical protein